MISIITLLVVLTLSILVTRIATVALTYTGLSRESAKFQARSAFTGVGFTTSESEKVVNHPMRRRVLMLLMLLGNAGVITAVSSLILSFINVESSAAIFWKIVLLVSGMLLLWVLVNSSWVERHLSRIIARGLKRYTSINVRDFTKLLHLSGEYQVNELQISNNHWLEGKTMAGAELRREGLIVLGITRTNGTYIGAPDGETEVRRGDNLLVYGRAEVLEELCSRSPGLEGARKHRQKVADQEAVESREKQKDRS